MFKSILKSLVFIGLCAGIMHVKSMNFSRAIDTIFSPKYFPHTISLSLASGLYAGYNWYKIAKGRKETAPIVTEGQKHRRREDGDIHVADDPYLKNIWLPTVLRNTTNFIYYNKRAKYGRVLCYILGGVACIQGVRGLIHYLSNR